jgi:hypothetical protein
VIVVLDVWIYVWIYVYVTLFLCACSNKTSMLGLVRGCVHYAE